MASWLTGMLTPACELLAGPDRPQRWPTTQVRLRQSNSSSNRSRSSLERWLYSWDGEDPLVTPALAFFRERTIPGYYWPQRTEPAGHNIWMLFVIQSPATTCIRNYCHFMWSSIVQSGGGTIGWPTSSSTCPTPRNGRPPMSCTRLRQFSCWKRWGIIGWEIGVIVHQKRHGVGACSAASTTEWGNTKLYQMAAATTTWVLACCFERCDDVVQRSQYYQFNYSNLNSTVWLLTSLQNFF
jgi:hypothetical protein